MNIIGCLDRPTEGKYLLDDVQIESLNDVQLANIGKEFEQFGVNRVYLSNNWRENPTARDYMTYEDLEAIQRVFGDKILGISPQFQDSAKILSRKETINIYLTGVNETYNKIQQIDLVDGRFLQEGDIKAKREVAVIDEATGYMESK